MHIRYITKRVSHNTLIVLYNQIYFRCRKTPHASFQMEYRTGGAFGPAGSTCNQICISRECVKGKEGECEKWETDNWKDHFISSLLSQPPASPFLWAHQSTLGPAAVSFLYCTRWSHKRVNYIHRIKIINKDSVRLFLLGGSGLFGLRRWLNKPFRVFYYRGGVSMLYNRVGRGTLVDGCPSLALEGLRSFPLSSLLLQILRPTELAWMPSPRTAPSTPLLWN